MNVRPTASLSTLFSEHRGPENSVFFPQTRIGLRRQRPAFDDRIESGQSQETATAFCLFLKPLIDIRADTRGILATHAWIRPLRPSHDQETQTGEILRLRQGDRLMRIHAQKQGQLQQQASLNLTGAIAKPFAAGQMVHPIRPLDSKAQGLSMAPYTTATPHFAHDSGRIIVHSKAPVQLQAKLTINTPGDTCEQEADRVAERVTSMPEPQLRRAGRCPNYGNQQAAVGHRPSRGTDSEQTVAPPIVPEVLRASSYPLDSSTQEFMELRFGHDFSQVRVHTDAQAMESAEAVNALAYTVGRHIVFGAGQYRPETTSGRRLLAHELTHAIQQKNGVQSELAINRPGNQYAHEADRAALAITGGEPPGVSGHTSPSVMRQLLKQPTAQSEENESQEDPKAKRPAAEMRTTFNYESISSDLSKLNNLAISGSLLSASSDIAILTDGIRTLRSVIQRADNLSISQQGANEISSKVLTLNNNLNTDVTRPLDIGKQQAVLVGVSAASFTGAESVGLPIVLEVLGEIAAAIAVILEAPIVIILAVIALIVLIIYLIYELFKLIVNEAERAVCIATFGKCIPRTRRKDDQSCAQCLFKCIHEGVWPENECPLRK